MGQIQSSQGRRGEENAERPREKNESEDTDFFTSDNDEEEAEKEAVPPRVVPIKTSHAEGNMRVWDQLTPSGTFQRMPSGAMAAGRLGQVAGEEVCTYVYVIRSGESSASALADELVGGRCASAVLTREGEQQARALGHFFVSHGLQFDAVFTSPLERCKQTARFVCQELNFSQERLEFGDALVEMNQGLWEGLQKSEVYNGDVVDIMTNLNQDFHAPGGGESQRQVEFRMVEFVNNVVLQRSLEMDLHHHKDARSIYYAKHDVKPSMVQVDMPPVSQKSDALVTGKGKSRIHVTTPPRPPRGIGSLMNVAKFDHKPPPMMQRPTSHYVALFSHEMAIQCFLHGVMNFPPQNIDRLCIDHTSVTLLKHSTLFGWKILHVNDTSHLRSL